MKLLTKEEEDAHYSAVVRGGILGGTAGLIGGALGNYILTKRWPFYRTLTIPFRAFFVTSTGTFFAIIYADRYSRAFEKERTKGMEYQDSTQRLLAERKKNMTTGEKMLDWGRENRYPIVTCSWLASMGASLAIVSRNKYLNTGQKLVQARMYAQGLTLAVLVATAALEVSDQRKRKEEGVEKEHYTGEDQWKGEFLNSIPTRAFERLMESRHGCG